MPTQGLITRLLPNGVSTSFTCPVGFVAVALASNASSIWVVGGYYINDSLLIPSYMRIAGGKMDFWTMNETKFVNSNFTYCCFGSDGHLWAVGFCSNGLSFYSRITLSGTCVTYILDNISQINCCIAGNDGQIWCVGSYEGVLGLIALGVNGSKFMFNFSSVYGIPFRIGLCPNGTLCTVTYNYILFMSLTGVILSRSSGFYDFTYALCCATDAVYIGIQTDNRTIYGKVDYNGTATAMYSSQDSNPISATLGPDGDLWYLCLLGGPTYASVKRVSRNLVVTDFVVSTAKFNLGQQWGGICVSDDNACWIASNFDPTQYRSLSDNMMNVGNVIQNRKSPCASPVHYSVDKGEQEDDDEDEWEDYEEDEETHFLTFDNLQFFDSVMEVSF